MISRTDDTMRMLMGPETETPLTSPRNLNGASFQVGQTIRVTLPQVDEGDGEPIYGVRNVQVEEV